jgi:general secretion pathway protein H
MRILAVGNKLTPTLFTACNALPPEGAVFSLGRPGGKIAYTFALTPPIVLSLSKDAPRGGWPCLGRPGAAAVVTTIDNFPIPLRSLTVPPQGAAAPAVSQSQSRGPCWLKYPPRSDLLPLPKGEGWGEGSPHSGPVRHRFFGRHHAGFTLLELLVVVAIIAVATAGVTLSLRDSSQTALEREAQRLAVLFESARAQSRASGTAVFWRPTIDGFRFEGLPPGALPTRWLEAGTRAGANVAIQLGPEPIIGAQAVDILSGSQEQSQPARVLRIATDGLRPFALQTTEPQP